MLGPWLVALLVGCATSTGTREELAAADTAGPAEIADTAGTDGDSGAPAEPAWFVVRATLGVSDGAPSSEGAEISLEIVDADLVRVDCTVALDTAALEPSASPDHPEILWWALPVNSLTPPCAPLPDALVLGLGALDGDVRARLGSAGRGEVADALYGAYLLLQDEPVAFGYAGTDDDFAGDAPASLPAPDGSYAFHPVYLVPLPE